LQVRHVGSDTVARGFRGGAAAWLGAEDEGWPQARRLLALAAIYDGATRTEAAKIGGVGLQIIRDWVLRFNARGPGCDLAEFFGVTTATRAVRREKAVMTRPALRVRL
jgi:hypothetical protein